MNQKTPMVCMECQEQPTKPADGVRRRHQVAPDGSRWRCFCSRSCASRAAGRENPIGPRALQANQEAYRRRVLKTILDALKPHSRVIDGVAWVEAKPLVRFILSERRTAYTRGATAQYQRARRDASRAA